MLKTLTFEDSHAGMHGITGKTLGSLYSRELLQRKLGININNFL